MFAQFLLLADKTLWNYMEYRIVYSIEYLLLKLKIYFQCFVMELLQSETNYSEISFLKSDFSL